MFQALREVKVSRQNFIFCLGWVCYYGVQYAIWARGERLHVKPGDDAKIVAAALQDLEQVDVLVAVCLDNSAIGEHHLEVDDLVTSESRTAGIQARPTT